MPPSDALVAIATGVLGTIGLPLTATCLTGNCTWPTTPTNALCSTCDNVRDQVVFTSNSSSESGLTYTLPLGGSDTNVTPGWPSISVSVEPDNIFVLLTSETNGSINEFRSGRQNIASIQALGIPSNSYEMLRTHYVSRNKTTIDPLIVAYNCDIYFCLQAYNASTINGAYAEQLVGIWDQMDLSMPSSFDLEDWLPGEPQAEWSFRAAPQSLNMMNSSTYKLDFVSRYFLMAALLNGIKGQVGYDALAAKPTFASGNSTTTTFDTALIKAMWQAANSTNTMATKVQQITESYTTYMRTELTAPPDKLYAPTLFVDTIFTTVCWEWLIYPLSLVLLGYIFFAATIWQTRRRKVLPWKSQRVSLLLANIDDATRDFAIGGLAYRDGLKERVGRIKVEMVFDGNDTITFKYIKADQEKMQEGSRVPLI